MKGTVLEAVEAVKHRKGAVLPPPCWALFAVHFRRLAGRVQVPALRAQGAGRRGNTAGVDVVLSRAAVDAVARSRQPDAATVFTSSALEAGSLVHAPGDCHILAWPTADAVAGLIASRDVDVLACRTALAVGDVAAPGLLDILAHRALQARQNIRRGQGGGEEPGRTIGAGGQGHHPCQVEVGSPWACSTVQPVDAVQSREWRVAADSALDALGDGRRARKPAVQAGGAGTAIGLAGRGGVRAGGAALAVRVFGAAGCRDESTDWAGDAVTRLSAPRNIHIRPSAAVDAADRVAQEGAKLPILARVAVDAQVTRRPHVGHFEIPTDLTRKAVRLGSAAHLFRELAGYAENALRLIVAPIGSDVAPYAPVVWISDHISDGHGRITSESSCDPPRLLPPCLLPLFLLVCPVSRSAYLSARLSVYLACA